MLTHFFVYAFSSGIPVDGKELWKPPFKSSWRHSSAMALSLWESNTSFSTWRRTRAFKSEGQPRTRGSSIAVVSHVDGSLIFDVSSRVSLYRFFLRFIASFQTTRSSDATTFSSTRRASSTKTFPVFLTPPPSSSTAAPHSPSSLHNKRRRLASWTSLLFHSPTP